MEAELESRHNHQGIVELTWNHGQLQVKQLQIFMFSTKWLFVGISWKMLSSIVRATLRIRQYPCRNKFKDLPTRPKFSWNCLLLNQSSKDYYLIYAIILLVKKYKQLFPFKSALFYFHVSCKTSLPFPNKHTLVDIL